ncbi:hypothetical protein [Phenylobacterium deserti]|uniref:Uncharacterized protein n=1 Tax=Phenylobacterium deserti TaxID=1914756 RepID=A0A328AT63_9CAUL|nr:hypothetical protein [Phenylobacterium deserti]RAK56876.1 hypothetical protein DJ018_02580 [Phenylobacterium deserti]
MSSSKHDLSGHTPTTLPRDDLEDDPGIGASKGTTISGEDPHILREGATNTEEGDTPNETDGLGSPTPLERERTHP